MGRPVAVAIVLAILCAGCERGPAAGDETLRALVQALRTGDEDAREQAIAGLAAVGARAVPALAGLRDDPDEDVRLAAVETLGKVGGAAVVEPLLAALGDGSADVRVAALEQLANVGDRRAVAPVTGLYGRDEEPRVRYECLTTLGALGDAGATDLLVRETRSPDPYVRIWSMDALCKMAAPSAPALAVRLAQDPEAIVRRQVMASCGQALGAPEAEPALLDLALHDADFETTVWARRLLMQGVQNEGAGSAGRERMRAAALPALTGAPDATLRAALVLGDLGDARATERLIEALRAGEPMVRHHAAYLLARIGDRRAVPALVAALEDPVVLVRVTAHSSLEWFAADGDAQARRAVDAYKGERFNQPLGR